MSEAAVGYAFEELAPSDPPPADAAARLLARADAEAEQIREQARTEGRREGREAGRVEIAAELSAAIGALAEAVRGIERLHDELAEALELDAIELAIELAGKIAAGAAPQAPRGQVIEAVRGALRRIGDRRRIVVLVSPDDLQAVSTAIEELASAGGGVELCELLADERVRSGGAIVRTAEGEVDASVATQLERAREVVRASLQAHPPAETPA